MRRDCCRLWRNSHTTEVKTRDPCVWWHSLALKRDTSTPSPVALTPSICACCHPILPCPTIRRVPVCLVPVCHIPICLIPNCGNCIMSCEELRQTGRQPYVSCDLVMLNPSPYIASFPHPCSAKTISPRTNRFEFPWTSEYENVVVWLLIFSSSAFFHAVLEWILIDNLCQW